MLYVNNYVGTDQIVSLFKCCFVILCFNDLMFFVQCMFQSWYLAADTQLFVLAPLVLYPMWRWRKVGLSLLASLSVLSIVVPFATTLANDTDPSFLPYAE